MSDTSDFCLGKLFFEKFKEYHDRVFLQFVDTGEEITYGEILSQSIRVALKLKKHGLTRNDIIATCTHHQKYTLLPIIAAQFLGMICVNFDSVYFEIPDTAHMLKLTQPKILFVTEQSLEFMKSCIKESGVETKLVVFEDAAFMEYLQPDNGEKHFCPLKIPETETALIIFSSGTTGSPKGVCLGYRSFREENVYNKVTHATQSSVLFCASYCVISAYSNLVKCIAHGNKAIVCKRFSIKDVWKAIDKYRVEIVGMAPYYARQCLIEKPKNIDTTSVKLFVIGGCSVTKELMLDLRETFQNAKVLHIYAQTELGGSLRCIFPLNQYEEQIKKPTSVGKIASNIQWKVVDLETESPVGPNTRGELRLKSDELMNGYYKMDSSFAYDAEGYLKTGDIVYYDEDNCMYVVDRIKGAFKYKGHHILPAIIEAVLLTHPAVKDGAVLGMPDSEAGYIPLGVVVLKKEYPDTKAEDIMNYVNERVQDFEKLRAGVKIVESIPKTVSVKTKRRDALKIVLKS